MTTLPGEGADAPDFALAADDGGIVRLSDLRGQWVVLFFYPKALTPGCTTEACDFRDLLGDLAAAGVAVLGISHDPVDTLRRFRARHDLSYPLLSDVEHEVTQAYGVYGLKKFMGREFMGIFRTTFLIDPEGRVVRVWPKVKVKNHAAEVLAEARRLQA